MESNSKTLHSVQPKILSTRWKRVLRITLFLLVIFELGLLYSIRAAGWIQTGSILHFGIAWVIVALPAIIVAIVLICNRLRFGTRSLLFFMVLAAVFFWMTAIPYWQYQLERSGAQQLRASNILFERQANLRFSSLTKYLTEPWQFPSGTADSSSTYFWLTPFVKDLSRVPPDRNIQEILLRNDAELQQFLQIHHVLSGLLVIKVVDPSDESLALLQTILPDHKQLKEIDCHFDKNEISPRLWTILKENRIPILWLGLPTSRSTGPFLPSDMPEWGFLDALTISASTRTGIVMHPKDSETLGNMRKLRFLESYGLKPKSSIDFIESLPNCQVYLH